MGVAATMSVRPEQRRAAEAAEAVFRAAGLPDALIQGALVNAYAESRLDPMARGDSGKSIGIWQLHEKWAGKGMSVADRQDVTKATQRILDVYNSSQGAPIRKEVAAGERNPGRLAYLWSLHVERPTGKEVEALRRRGLALLLFPGADLMASRPDGNRESRLTPAPPSSSVAAPLLTVAALLGLLLVARRRRLASTP